MEILYRVYRYFGLGLLLIGLVLSTPVTASETESKNDTSRIDALKEALELDKKVSDKKQSLITPVLVPDNYLDKAGKEALKTSLTAYYKYRTTGYRHRERVFEWQLLSSKVIFVVVIFLVLSGIYFSWLQFKVDLRKKNETADVNKQQSVSSIEASTEGIKVTSPVLGVIILVISLLFFYLYLHHVYPIEEIL